MSNSQVSSTGNNRREAEDRSTGGGGGSSIATEASAKARELASDAADTVTQQAKRLLDGQLGAGADLIASVAGATRRASEDLEQKSPQIAKLVQSVADRADAYSGQLREQSVEDRGRGASEPFQPNAKHSHPELPNR